MSFISIDFLIFFPIVAILYYVIPRKAKHVWLLLSSYFFYMGWNPKYALLILLSTVITYISGIAIQRVNDAQIDTAVKEKRRKLCVFLSFFTNLSILAFFKYANFAIANINSILSAMHIEVKAQSLDILLPVGISFYTFQALSYTMDVYRGEIKAERNFIRYALFVSFFPQLVAGPIERSKNLLKQINEEHKFDFEQVRDGLMLMIWGYFLKMVIADRIAVIVDTVFGNVYAYRGAYFVVATVLFAIQIYCDFAGYSTIAVGASKVMGFTLMENFNAPYMARSVADFWRRWHISLTSWFRDYLYIPLGGNRKGKARKWINIMIVFLLSGLWHGAEWSFVLWGGLNGLFQIIGAGLKPIRDRIVAKCHLDRESLSHKLFQTVGTFILVDFAWIFFRANNVKEAFHVIGSMFSYFNPWVLTDGSLYELGLSRQNFTLMIIAILVLLMADLLKYRGVVIRNVIYKQEGWFRWLVLVFAVTFILIFGVWGYGYDAAAFIYFQF